MSRGRRITENDRQKMAKALMIHKYKGDALRLYQQYSDLALQVYRNHYSPKVRQQMAALPKGWLPSVGSIYVKLGDVSAHLHFDGCYQRAQYKYKKDSGEDLVWKVAGENRPEKVSLLMPYSDNGSCVAVFDVGHPFVDKFRELEGCWSELNEEIANAQARARGIFRRYTTFSKLIEAWPEVLPFVPKEAAPPPQLPALPAAELNALFDLPVDEAA